VLKKTKLAESDLIITMLSEDGRQIRAVAKGARKPGSKCGPVLEVYNVASMLLHTGRSLDIVSEATGDLSNTACRSDVEHNAAAGAVAELLEKVTRDSETEPRVYALSLAALAAIGQAGPDALVFITAASLMKITAQIGYRPVLAHCALCGAGISPNIHGDYAVSLPDGGVICDDCLGAGRVAPIDIPSDELEWISFAINSTYADIQTACSDNAGMERIGDAFLTFTSQWMQTHMSIRLKSLDMLRVLSV
jgi:DNA repair protein RecO (recombination protein O)